MAAPFASTIATQADLRALYKEPHDRVKAEKVARIDEATRAFIEGVDLELTEVRASIEEGYRRDLEGERAG